MKKTFLLKLLACCKESFLGLPEKRHVSGQPNINAAVEDAVTNCTKESFLGLPVKMYVSGQPDINATVEDAITNMVEYTDARKVALSDKVKMCDSRFEDYWRKRQFAVIELSDVVLKFEDWYKVFEYLGLEEILLAKSTLRNSGSERISAVSGENIAGNQKQTSKRLHFTGSFVVLNICGFDGDQTRCAEFECGDFYIFAKMGGFCIIIARKDTVGKKDRKPVDSDSFNPKPPLGGVDYYSFGFGLRYRLEGDDPYSVRHYRPLSELANVLKKNSVWFLTPYGEYTTYYCEEYSNGYFNENYDDKFINAGVMYPDGKMLYNIQFHCGAVFHISSCDFSETEFWNLVKEQKALWRKKVKLIYREPIRDSRSEARFYIRFNTVKVLLPESLLSC